MLKANSLVSPVKQMKKLGISKEHCTQHLHTIVRERNQTKKGVVYRGIQLRTKASEKSKLKAQNSVVQDQSKAKGLKAEATGVCKCKEKNERLSSKDQKLLVCLQLSNRRTKPLPICKVSIDLDQMIINKRKQQPPNIPTQDVTCRQTSLSITSVSPEYRPILQIYNKDQGNSAPTSKTRSLLSHSKQEGQSPLTRRRPSKDIRESLMGRWKNQRDICQVDSKEGQRQAGDISGSFFPSAEQVLSQLYRKLTADNLPYQNWLNYLNFNLSALSMQQLQFISILFQRVEPSYLNSMDFTAFKYKAQQKCPSQLKEFAKHYCL